MKGGNIMSKPKKDPKTGCYVTEIDLSKPTPVKKSSKKGGKK